MTFRSPAIPTLLLLAAVAGCRERLDTEYGKRDGLGASSSVNGTAVLAEMFEEAGHRVFSWTALSPRLEQRADCIVWFPNDFEPPNEEVRAWLEDWIYEEPGRTLIYVGRDFDAAVWYWDIIEKQLEGELRDEARRQKRLAEADYRLARNAMPRHADCGWFQVDGGYRPRDVRRLEGDPRWRKAINPEKLAIELNGRLVYPPNHPADVLLSSEGDALIAREEWRGSRLITVTNGSFLLNLPLVNHEHRKLAGKLIAEIGTEPQTVVFLESGPGGPPIREEDPSMGAPTGLEIFNVWPTSFILWHLTVAGILFCFSRWPIFGRPRRLPPPESSDFGRHVEAVAELLKQGADQSYAMTRVVHYQQVVRGGE